MSSALRAKFLVFLAIIGYGTSIMAVEATAPATLPTDNALFDQITTLYSGRGTEVANLTELSGLLSDALTEAKKVLFDATQQTTLTGYKTTVDNELATAQIGTQFKTAIAALTADPATAAGFTTAMTEVTTLLGNTAFQNQANLTGSADGATLATKIKNIANNRAGKSTVVLNQLKTLLTNAVDAKITYLDATAKGELNTLLAAVNNDYNAQDFVDKLAVENSKPTLIDKIKGVRALLSATTNVTLDSLKGKKAIATPGA